MLLWCILGNDYQPCLTLSFFLTSHCHAVSLLQCKLLLAYLYLLCIYIAHRMYYCIVFPQSDINLPHPLPFPSQRDVLIVGEERVFIPDLRLLCWHMLRIRGFAISVSILSWAGLCAIYHTVDAMLNKVTLPWSAQTQLWRELARGSRCCSVRWCRV